MCNSYTLQLAFTTPFPVLLLSDNLWTKIDRSKFSVMNIELKWYATTLYWTMAVNLWKRRLLRPKYRIPYTWRCKVSVFDLRNIPVDSLHFYIFFCRNTTIILKAFVSFLVSREDSIFVCYSNYFGLISLLTLPCSHITTIADQHHVIWL